MATIRPDAVLGANRSDPLIRRISQLIFYGRQHLRPLHERMDRWAAMYFLMDEIQQAKPVGYRRFISNEPHTAIDAAVSILTRNEPFWRIPLNQTESENPDERDKIGKVERSLQGVVTDIDELFSMRGEMPLWKQVAYQVLLRGQVWGKFHVTTAALEYRESPIISTIYDARLVYPHYDDYGMDTVVMESVTSLGELANLYPVAYQREISDRDYDPNRTAMKIEFWSNDRGAVKGVTGLLAVLAPAGSPGSQPYFPLDIIGGASTEGAGISSASGARWLIPAHEHGYDPQSLPVIGVFANGVPIKIKPSVPRIVSQSLDQRADQFGINAKAWHGPNTWIAESGRSILAAVEETVPQMNELVATILHHFSLGTFGTWVFKSPTGEMPRFTPNIEGRIPLRPEESIERIEPSPINQDAYRLLELLRQEQQQGTLSAILRATLPGGGGDLSSGILFQQMTNAALNALEPFHDGMETFGKRMGTSLLNQFQLAATVLKPFTVTVPFKQHSHFDIEFDPQADLVSGRKYKAVPVFKPALPDDMSIRIQMARLALDPRRPVLSLVSVLENILQWDDPDGEQDRMWEDLANMDPWIALEQIAQAMEKIDEPEMAERIRESQFRQKFVEDMQFRQVSGTMPQPEGGGMRLGPESGVAGSTARNEGAPESQDEAAAMAAEGMQLVGAMGERSGV